MAKINISVSSDSSKPRITISKGPVGPQGEQGPQGEAGETGPQGPAGTVLDIEDIPNVQIPSLADGGYDNDPLNTPNGNFLFNSLVYDPQNSRWTTFMAAEGDIETSENKQGSPPPNNLFTDPVIRNDFQAADRASAVSLSLNNSNVIPNDVNLYVNGDARINGSLQVSSNGTTEYRFPATDGQMDQFLQTNGNGFLRFVDVAQYPAADSTKLAGIAANATANDTDANLKNRSNHTGTQLANTISDFASAVGDQIALASVEDLSDITDVGSGEIITSAERTKLSGIADGAGVNTNISNANLTLDDSRSIDQNGDDLTINPNGGVFSINDSSGLPTAPEIQVGQGQLDLMGLRFPSSDGTSGQAIITNGSGVLSFGDSFSQSDFDTAFGNKSIDALSDVDTTTVAPTDGQALVWDNAASQWEPGTIEGGVTSIVAGSGIDLSPTNGLGDVTVSVNTTIDYLSLKMGSDVLQGGANQQDFTSATAVKTKFNTADDSEGSGLTADTTNNRITVSSDGLYRLTANLSFYSGSARITPTTFFKINGSTDLLGESYGYIRAATGQNKNSNNVTRVVRLSANDYVEVWHFDASTATGSVYATQALFEVESLPGSATGPQGATGAQGPSGTSYDVVTITADTTLSSSHTTKYLVCNSSTPIDLTVPSSASYDTYAEFVIEQRGTGAVTVVAANGVTINSTESLRSSGQYAIMGLKRTAANVYTLTGERLSS